MIEHNMSTADALAAQLQQTQRDLAASQADLTRVTRELHEALRRSSDLEQVREELRQAKLRIDGDLMDIQDLARERDDAREELTAKWEKAMAEGDQLSMRVFELRKERDVAQAAVADVESHRILAARQRDRAEKDRDLARAELVSARQELQQQRELLDQHRLNRPYEVAVADRGDCPSCRAPVVRGQAVEASVFAGAIRHVVCPDPVGCPACLQAGRGPECGYAHPLTIPTDKDPQ